MIKMIICPNTYIIAQINYSMNSIPVKHIIGRFVIFFIFYFFFYVITPVMLSSADYFTNYSFDSIYLTVITVTFLINIIVYLWWLAHIKQFTKASTIPAFLAAFLFYGPRPLFDASYSRTLYY